MPTQYTSKQLREMTNSHLIAARTEWAEERKKARTLFWKEQADFMLDRIKRECERRGL